MGWGRGSAQNASRFNRPTIVRDDGGIMTPLIRRLNKAGARVWIFQKNKNSNSKKVFCYSCNGQRGDDE